MHRSFTKARPKHLISPEMRLVFFFFGVTFLMLGSTYLFLLYKSHSFKRDIVEIAARTEELKSTIVMMDDKMAFIHDESRRAEQIFTANTVLEESIRNLFDLVPERIVLSKADLTKDSLILYGITPNKEVYDFLLHAPLRSIFHRTYSSFYPIEDGWYRFVSTNYLDEEEL